MDPYQRELINLRKSYAITMGRLIDAQEEVARLRAENAELRLRQTWVACSDRMPDNGQNVAFVVASRDPGYAERVLGGRYNAGVGFSVPGATFDATHWMPLPEPPVECRERGEGGE